MNLASMVRWVLFGQKRILNLQLVHKIMLTNLYNSGKIRDVRSVGLRIIDDALNEVNNNE